MRLRIINRSIVVLAALIAAATAASTTAQPCTPEIVLVGEEFDLSSGATTQRRLPWPAHNATDDEYLIVWLDSRNPGENDIFGQRISADGQLLGENIAIIEFPSSQGNPSIAYNSVANEYLVAWQTQQSGAFNHGWGRRVAANGTVIGNHFSVSNGGLESSLTYNSQDNEYFYEGRNFAGGGQAGIRGQRVTAAGNLIGPNVTISNVGAPAPCGQVIYNLARNEYLATWRDQNSRDLRGQRIAADGGLIGGPIIISSEFPESGRAASVAVDAENDRYLVAYGVFQGQDIFAQFVEGDGSLLGDPIAVAPNITSRASPFLVYNENAEAYVFAWRESQAIKMQLVLRDGVLSGERVTIASGFASSDPRMAANSLSDEILVTWTDNRNLGQGEQDAYAQIIRLLGDCLGACCISGECADTTEEDCPTGGCVRDPKWLCDGDVDGDGQVNPVDSGLVQAAFGSSDEADLCQFDIDCDGQINPVDSGIVQSLFGTCDAPRDTCGSGAWFEGENCEDFECP